MANTPAGGTSVSPRHSRIALVAFVLLLVAAMAAGYTVFRRLAANEERNTTQTLSHIADIEATAISAWVLERLADARVFGSGHFFGESVHEWLAAGAPEGTAKQRLMEQLVEIKRVYGYLDAAILDDNGNVLLTTQEKQGPVNPITAETVRRAVTTSRTQVSSIHAADDYTEIKRMVDIAAPLQSARDGGKTPSVLLLRGNADMHLEPFVQSMPLLATSTQVLLAEIENQKVVTTSVSENAVHYGDHDVLPIAPVALVDAARNPLLPFMLTKADGRTALSVAQKIDGVPWYLIAMIDNNATRAGFARLAWSVAGVAAAVLFLLGTALLLWWRQKDSSYRFEALKATTAHDLLQRQYDFLSKYANDMIALARIDGTIVDVNDKTVQVIGRSRESLVGASLTSLFLPSGEETLNRTLKRLQFRGTALFEMEKQDTEGRIIPVEVSARAIQLDEGRFIQLICRDVTERKQAEAALRESQDRLNATLATILDVVWSFSPDLSRITYINQSVERIFGYPPAEFSERPRLWFDAIYPEDRGRVEDCLRALTAVQPLCDIEYRILRHDAMIRWLHTRGKLVVDEDGKHLRIDGVTSDITQRKAAEQQVQILAYYDNVTGLPNRRLLQDRLAQSMQMAARSRKKVALLFMDLDNFKNINDSLGHHIGDLLLRDIAHRLLQCVRGEDTVARIGGDEFLVVLPDLEKSGQAVPVAEKILASTALPGVLDGQQIHTTISIGISVYPDDGRDPNELIRHADTALYQAKSHGRDNYQFFTRELNDQITRSSSIERQLRAAVDNNQLSLWYQPQIDTRSGRLIGAEALLRWRRADGTFLSPVEFIPVAEERGLIGRIGEWAMREACAQCRRWQEQGLPIVPVAVNVSPIQFQQKSFASLVTGILAETGLDATMLELEITESAIMRRAPQVAELATRLREVGVGISIDDFGTGYSSLSYLKQIPIDKIKIDRSFIADMLDDDDDNAITFAIVNLAHSLNLRVIAEGVETKAQIDRLRLFGCDEVQGHYYSSAVSAEIFETFLGGGAMRAATVEAK